jgi:hypothetical protein
MSEGRLPPLPDGFERTRESLHGLAEQVVKVAREHVTGEFTMIRTPGGFGTPVFGEDRQVRVDGAELVVRDGGEERRAPITSLAAAAELVGPGMLPEGLELSGKPLEIDPAAAAALAAAYEAAERTLERLVAGAGEGDDATAPTLWPEHFDLAIELGSESGGRRANYGLSPGDADHPEPYFYVGPWSAAVEGGLWNASGFSGAELGYSELAAAADPAQAALDFSLERKRALER